MNKYKLISIIEGIIIIVLVVSLILNLNGKDTAKKEVIKQDIKKYVGIYHNDNYKNEKTNIIINEDNTCEFTFYSSDIYYCKYEKIDNDELKIIVGTYGSKNNYGTTYNLAPTKEKCEEVLEGYKERNTNSSIKYDDCQNEEINIEVTLLENGLLYKNEQFTKIK